MGERAKRAGVTRKVSLSINAADLAVIKKRAKRLYDGNVSALFTDLIAEMKRLEAWERMKKWYGKPIAMTDAERDEIDDAILGKTASKSRNARPRKSVA